MANNRLYLVDTETYEWIMLAKGYTNGWDYLPDCALEEFLTNIHNPRDLAAALGNEQTKLALFTEGNLPKECTPQTWVGHR